MKNKLPLIWKNMFQAQGFLEKEVSKKKKARCILMDRNWSQAVWEYTKEH